MHAAATSPEQGANILHLPPEIIEHILLYVPLKSLLRFKAVAKSWKSMIVAPKFIQKRQRYGRGSIVTIHSLLDHLTVHASVCRISRTSPEIEDSTGLFFPTEIKEAQPRLLASCEELWLVELESTGSLFLWNHSLRTCLELPNSYQSCRETNWIPSAADSLVGFVYGLAYDSAADDFKVLKIARSGGDSKSAKMYSLNSNAWKEVRASSRDSLITQSRCEFVNGAFHWIATGTLASFDLSREKYGHVPQPNYRGCIAATTEAAVLNGMLCVCANYPDRCGFILWAMKDYGVEESWTKMLDIEYSPSFNPCITLGNQNPHGAYDALRPLYLHDNGDVLFNTSCKKYNMGLFMYKNEGALFDNVVDRDGKYIYGGFIYNESLIDLRNNAKKKGRKEMQRWKEKKKAKDRNRGIDWELGMKGQGSNTS